ncbi:choice-of-anchor tandem repeat NxxGxxAF-containing protein [Ornithinimicrobium cavernae]|uniref:choice-of-anchor tandem repeat NxxGxxAF-containing protein n=1 Tax=Ornithinimicrobium cavernae TaxID=2666047 RepID=UPI0012B16CE9|nr:choice-of-anchor tandem repeat NxxGxxAF-containing protein [Ornithinimicrobium cavernae]
MFTRPRPSLRRSFTTVLGVAPLVTALVAALGAAPMDTPGDPYSDTELQARTNLLANDAGHNLPPGSSFNSITPQINATAEVSFRVQYVAGLDPTVGRPGVWFGSAGQGEIVHTGDEGGTIPGEAILNDHGDIAFTLGGGGVDNMLYLYDADAGTASRVGTAPVLPNSYSSAAVDNDGNIGFQASFSAGRALAALRDGTGVFYASDRGLDPESPFTYFYTAQYNHAGQIAVKVSTSDDKVTAQELRVFEPDGSSSVLLANQAVDPQSPYKKFDNSIAVNDEGVIAAVAERVSDGAKVVVRTDGETVTEIAAESADGPVRTIEYFRPDINNAGQVVFRAVGPAGQVIYVGDGGDLVEVAAKGDVVATDLGTAQLGQHNTSPVFGGGPTINDRGDVAFAAGVHPEGDNQVEWGTGVFVAYGGGDGSEPPVGEASEEIVATVPEDVGEGSLLISVDQQDRTVQLPEMASLGDRLTTAGELRPVTVTDSRASDPGWDVSAQVSEFVAAEGAGSFGGGFLGWSPTVGSSSDGQVVTPGGVVAPGFPSGEGLSVPRPLGSAETGAGRGSAVLGAGLELQIPVDTTPGVYTAVLTITAI